MLRRIKDPGGSADTLEIKNHYFSTCDLLLIDWQANDKLSTLFVNPIF